jgi:flagellar biosynthesis regulator FlaF
MSTDQELDMIDDRIRHVFQRHGLSMVEKAKNYDNDTADLFEAIYALKTVIRKLDVVIKTDATARLNQLDQALASIGYYRNVGPVG